MGVIRKLSPELVNQIAAGEVIERPASALKELVENAVDAGARRIEVALEDGGRRLVRVSDDGGGIAADDLPLAVASHATSKIGSLDDLFRVRTLGFRGEALASMGSVAELRVASRPRGADGAEIEVRGGQVGPVRPAGVASGTTVELRNLFFNTPARRKFLRDGPAEMRACVEALTRLALGAPGVALRLAHEGKLVLECGPAATLRERIADLFGRDVERDLVEIETGPGAVRARGFAALPRRTRGDALWQHVTLDGRPIRDKLVSGAIKEAYQGFLMTRRHPIVFIALAADPEAVDVNVHPAKLEVRFREPREVFSRLVRAIRGALEAARVDPVLEPAGAGPQRSERGPAQIRADGGAGGELGTGNWELGIRNFPFPAPSSQFGPAAACVAEPIAEYRPGPLAPATEPPRHLQLASGYLLVETAAGFEVIDPHALHERILYEEIRARIAAGAVEVQSLLIPTIVELTALEEARLEAARDDLAAIGLVVEPFGPRTAAVQAVPAILWRVRDWAAVLRDLLGALEDGGAAPGRPALLEHLTATMACKAATKLGERLQPGEVQALLERRALADRSHLCPHGRPTALQFPAQELERQFKR